MGLSGRCDATSFPFVSVIPHDIPWSRGQKYSCFMDVLLMAKEL